VQQGPLLLVGAGVQAWAHAEAFVHGLGVKEVWVNSRRRSSAQMLVDQLDRLNIPGVVTKVVEDVQQAAAHCPLIVTCTPARQTVLDAVLSPHHFVAAVGAFTPQMAELSPQVCQQAAREGIIVLDTADARHEAGDLIQAQLNILTVPTLQDVVRGTWSRQARTGCVLFKSCGWAGWDLAAARLAVAQERV
jgi:ornithine cyclodeaminase